MHQLHEKNVTYSVKFCVRNLAIPKYVQAHVTMFLWCFHDELRTCTRAHKLVRTQRENFPRRCGWTLRRTIFNTIRTLNAHIHLHRQTLAHTLTHTLTRTHVCSHKHTRSHTHMYTYTHTHTNTYARTNTYAHTHTHTHSLSHTLMQTLAHTLMHAHHTPHTHTYPVAPPR